MTLRVILKYVGEGESARIVHTEQDGKTGYFQVVPEYDWVNDDPVWKGEHPEWLATELEPALRSLRHPWPKLYGLQVAPEALALVKTILTEQGVAWDRWWTGERQPNEPHIPSPSFLEPT